MIKIGVLGAGRLGKIHIKLIQEINEFELIGFYDIDEERAKEIEKEFKIKAYTDPESLIEDCDAIDIVTPTSSHFDYAMHAFRNSKHVFIEKPVTSTLEEAEKLVKLAAEANVKVQVGHVERYNPALKASLEYINTPMFIEAHRLSSFSPRGTDVSVVLDLMIHDIDIVLSTVKSNIKKISASGVSVVTDLTDMASVRLEFDNGCVANLTASRISLKKMRKIRFFQKDAYISVDLLDKKSKVVRIKEANGNQGSNPLILDLGEKGKKEIYFSTPQITDDNAIKQELICFAESINNDTPTPIGIEDGHEALNIAYQIMEKIKLTTDEL